ncbi:hypothetical protein EAH89_27310 [Roseomonas nepalensis]|uniref:Uncharacterized protein n=2 Tax=Muricoccus nepalensis TaxID=1854500 RepID=A0A502F395_9PROT|nr:hypothetical protein EAH89_27310 [Roseomonas nepalensis]
MVAASLAEAMDVMLGRTAEGDQPSLIRTLRTQMERVLTESPVGGDPLQAIAVRSRLAVLFDAEFARHECAEGNRQKP